MTDLPQTMRAAAIDSYGGPDVLKLQELPVPELSPGEVLISVRTAGVGVWDRMERSGQIAAMVPDDAKGFPRVIGADGAGEIVAAGEGVGDFAVGDAVYGYGFLNPKGGFYAEYAAIPATQVSLIPAGLDHDQAGALAVSAMTALRGLDALSLQPGQVVCVFGASGGVGHPAVQLAKILGLTVIAAVSTEDGAELAKKAGADLVVDTTQGSVGESIAARYPEGISGLLATVNAPGLDQAISTLGSGGKVAYPHGVQPEPTASVGIEIVGYDGQPDATGFERLNGLIATGKFEVFIAESFPLEEAAQAHVALEQRRLGRTILKVR